MYLFILAQILMIEWWHLGLTAIAMIISTFIGMYNINRARKKDLQNQLDKKADIAVVNREFKIRDERIIKVEDLGNIHNEFIREQFEEHRSILENLQTDIKKIISKKI